mmetsp:Transcript_21131/g.45850  ORF Transcript_21131/g.45850 Transcript_21131/m.45850 type:complete len:236 (+) Transcript_21131:184-891(+)
MSGSVSCSAASCSTVLCVRGCRHPIFVTDTNALVASSSDAFMACTIGGVSSQPPSLGSAFASRSICTMSVSPSAAALPRRDFNDTVALTSAPLANEALRASASPDVIAAAASAVAESPLASLVGGRGTPTRLHAMAALATKALASSSSSLDSDRFSTNCSTAATLVPSEGTAPAARRKSTASLEPELTAQRRAVPLLLARLMSAPTLINTRATSSSGPSSPKHAARGVASTPHSL